MLVYGLQPILPYDTSSETNNQELIEKLLDMVDKVSQLYQDAYQAMTKVQSKLTQSYIVKHPHAFKIRDLVFYFDKTKVMQYHTKLQLRWRGPYIISAICLKEYTGYLME